MTGDKVAVIATARSVDKQAVETGIKILQQWGLSIVPGKSLYHQNHLFAGNDEQRVRDLQLALDNPEIKAIFCARGGYGTSRIIDTIRWDGFKKSPKWVCGFSDVTTLLCHINCLGYACLHSTMPQLFSQNNVEGDYNSLRSALFDSKVSLKADIFPDNQQGTCQGVLVGGNLSLLVHLIGTSSEVDMKDKILIIEEVDEYLYHLDRMMVQLKRTGKLRQIKGLVVGHLTKMKEGDLKFGKTAAGVIRSHLKGSKIPLGFGFQFGHQSPNLAVPLGITGQLSVTKKGSKLQLEY